jgi:hypothetical protein
MLKINRPMEVGKFPMVAKSKPNQCRKSVRFKTLIEEHLGTRKGNI